MLAWVAKQFAARGHKVYLIAAYASKDSGMLDKRIRYFTMNLTRSKCRLIRNTMEMIHILYQTNKIVCRINPDFVAGFLYSIDYFFTIYNYFFGKHKILLSQRLDPYSQKGISARIKKWAVEQADGAVFQTESARAYYRKKTAEKGIVIPNPVTERTMQFAGDVKPFAERKNIIAVPARLDIRQKRQDVIIRAFELVFQKHPELKLVLLGNGPDKNRIRKMIQDRGLEQAVMIHRAVPVAEAYIKDCKIVCLSSDYEGSPNALIEAMAMGINVCATDCSPGGARALIRDGENGFLTERRDYRTLAEKICLLLEDAGMADRLAAEAKKIGGLYAEEEIASRWINYAQKVCGK